MSRRDRVQLIVEEHAEPESRLDAWKAAEDERLDARDDERREATTLFERVAQTVEGEDDFIVDGLLKPLAVFGKGLLKPRTKRDPDVRWPNEVAALRAYLASADRGQRSPTARLAVHCQTGGTFSAAQRPAEPRLDDGIRHVGRAVAALDPAAIDWLVRAYIELRPPRMRTEGGKARNGAGNGYGGEAVSSAMAIAAAAREAGDSSADWHELVAEACGLATDEATLEQIDAAVKGAKRRLRAALRAVELDARPRLLIPRPTRREVEGTRAPEVVATCIGSAIVDGVRGACEAGEALAADVAACPRCERCGRPWGARAS